MGSAVLGGQGGPDPGCLCGAGGTLRQFPGESGRPSALGTHPVNGQTNLDTPKSGAAGCCRLVIGPARCSIWPVRCGPMFHRCGGSAARGGRSGAGGGSGGSRRGGRGWRGLWPSQESPVRVGNVVPLGRTASCFRNLREHAGSSRGEAGAEIARSWATGPTVSHPVATAGLLSGLRLAAHVQQLLFEIGPCLAPLGERAEGLL